MRHGPQVGWENSHTTIRPEDGWIRNKGLRVYGGGHRIEIPWPQLEAFPDYGLARTRHGFDHALARHARAAGATILERTAVTGPVLHERTGRVVGVSARPVDDAGQQVRPATAGSSRSATGRRTSGWAV